MADVRSSKPPTAADHDQSGDIIRLVIAHAAVVAAPALIVGVLIVPLGVAILIALLIGAVVTVLRLRDIGGHITASIGAEPLSAAERPRLHNVVESAAMAVGVARPSVHVIESDTRNAVTWSDGSAHVSIAFTTGLLDAVDRIELEAVVARQLTVARDAPLDVVAVAGTLFAPLGRGPLEATMVSLVHRMVDDRTVVLVDLAAVQATCYPPGLVTALGLVSDMAEPPALSGVPQWLSAFCLAAPAADSGPFAMHPPIEDRIDLLREI